MPLTIRLANRLPFAARDRSRNRSPAPQARSARKNARIRGAICSRNFRPLNVP